MPAGYLVKELSFFKSAKFSKYLNVIGPDVNWCLNKGKTFERIVEGALKTNAEVNRYTGVQ